MAVGKMRHRLQLQSKSTTSDGGGSAAVASWTTFATVYGEITPQSGGERFFGDKLEEPITHVIKLRFRRDLSFQNRIKYTYRNGDSTGTRIFNIKRVINAGTRDKYLLIQCVEGVAT